MSERGRRNYYVICMLIINEGQVSESASMTQTTYRNKIRTKKRARGGERESHIWNGHRRGNVVLQGKRKQTKLPCLDI